MTDIDALRKVAEEATPGKRGAGGARATYEKGRARRTATLAGLQLLGPTTCWPWPSLRTGGYARVYVGGKGLTVNTLRGIALTTGGKISMSACISRSGEYSDHVPGEGAERFLCQRCWVFDEDAALAALSAAEAGVARCRALADEADECWVTHSTTMRCTDMIGGGIGNAKWTTEMCCLPCRLRAALDGDT